MSTSENIVDDGWAIRRNGSCLDEVERDCGATMAPFRACCPVDKACPSQWNAACCQEGFNCTLTINEPAPQDVKCSNATWSLFTNNGYFCCEPGLQAWNLSNSNGCSPPSQRVPNGAIILPLIKSGVPVPEPTPSASSTSVSGSTSVSNSQSNSASPSASNTPPANDNSSSSSSNTGAIAGGVVGGIAGLAIIGALVWFLLRRRKQKLNEKPPAYEADGTAMAAEAMGSPGVTKYRHDYHGVHEVAGDNRITGELHANQKPVELPADSR